MNLNNAFYNINLIRVLLLFDEIVGPLVDSEVLFIGISCGPWLSLCKTNGNGKWFVFYVCHYFIVDSPG